MRKDIEKRRRKEEKGRKKKNRFFRGGPIRSVSGPLALRCRKGKSEHVPKQKRQRRKKGKAKV